MSDGIVLMERKALARWPSGGHKENLERLAHPNGPMWWEPEGGHLSEGNYDQLKRWRETGRDCHLT